MIRSLWRCRKKCRDRRCGEVRLRRRSFGGWSAISNFLPASRILDAASCGRPKRESGENRRNRPFGRQCIRSRSQQLSASPITSSIAEPINNAFFNRCFFFSSSENLTLEWSMRALDLISVLGEIRCRRTLVILARELSSAISRTTSSDLEDQYM